MTLAHAGHDVGDRETDASPESFRPNTMDLLVARVAQGHRVAVESARTTAGIVVRDARARALQPAPQARDARRLAAQRSLRPELQRRTVRHRRRLCFAAWGHVAKCDT